MTVCSCSIWPQGSWSLTAAKFSAGPAIIRLFWNERAQALEVEAAQRIDFDRKLAEEEVWIRKGC